MSNKRTIIKKNNKKKKIIPIVIIMVIIIICIIVVATYIFLNNKNISQTGIRKYYWKYQKLWIFSN